MVQTEASVPRTGREEKASVRVVAALAIEMAAVEKRQRKANGKEKVWRPPTGLTKSPDSDPETLEARFAHLDEETRKLVYRLFVRKNPGKGSEKGDFRHINSSGDSSSSPHGKNDHKSCSRHPRRERYGNDRKARLFSKSEVHESHRQAGKCIVLEGAMSESCAESQVPAARGDRDFTTRVSPTLPLLNVSLASVLNVIKRTGLADPLSGEQGRRLGAVEPDQGHSNTSSTPLRHPGRSRQPGEIWEGGGSGRGRVLSGQERQAPRNRETPPVIGGVVFNHISGGLGITGGETSNPGRRSVGAVLSITNKRPRGRSDIPGITFFEEDADHVTSSHEDPLVVTPPMGNFNVKRVLVDTRSSADVLFYATFQGMVLREGGMKPLKPPLWGFDGSQVESKGIITSPVEDSKMEIAGCART